MSNNASKVAVVPIKRKAAYQPKGHAAYAGAVRRYKLNTPVFLYKNGTVHKRHTPHLNIRPRSHEHQHHSFFASLFHHHDQKPLHSKPEFDDEPTTEVPAIDIQHDIQYVIPVKIGTPGIWTHLDLDTGSSDTWVKSTETQPPIQNPQRPLYDPTRSSTAVKADGETWKISYGDKSGASGDVYYDVIQIGDIRIENQAIEVAKQISQEFIDDVASDGLTGFSLPKLNTVRPNPVKTPLQNIIDQCLAPGILTACLDQDDSRGFYTIGGTDSNRAGVSDEEIQYTKVDPSLGFWVIDSKDVIVNGKVIPVGNPKTIVDSGTTLVLLATDIVKAIYATIPGSRLDQQQGGYVYPTGAQVPDVQIPVGNNHYRLPKKLFGFADAGNGMTFGVIQDTGDIPVQILGDGFLKAVYVVFDEENLLLGVAERYGNVEAD